MRKSLLILLIGIAFVGCDSKLDVCQKKLNKLDVGSVLDTLNNEFEIVYESNEYVKGINGFNLIEYETIQVDKEMGDDDTLNVTIESSQILLSYSHFPYSQRDFIPHLSFKNDSAIIKCQTAKIAFLDCKYNGEMEVAEMMASSLEYVSWELKISKDKLKGKQLYFLPKRNLVFKVPVDTIGEFIDIKPL